MTAGRLSHGRMNGVVSAGMPTVLRERGYRFFFYMADSLEPAHIHVERDESAAKIWLDPLEFSFVDGFRDHECREILGISSLHVDELLT